MTLVAEDDGYGCTVWLCSDFDKLPFAVIIAVIRAYRHGSWLYKILGTEVWN